MKKIKILFIKTGIGLLNIIYFLFKILPTKKKITFISRQSDTPTIDISLLSKEINTQLSEYKVIILTKKLDNKFKYFFHMFKQMYHIATSKIVILDSYSIVISVLKHKKSLTVIQMWHAIGSMKKFGYAMIDKEEGNSKEIAEVMKMHKNYDFTLISSHSFDKDYIEGFNISKDIIKEIPLPKVDLLLNKDYKKEMRNKLYKKIPQLKEKKNILYCSTFRKKQPNGCKNIDDLVKEIDFNKYNLLYKPHPFNTITTADKKVITDFDNTFEALFIADYVITDYSSIIYEIGLLNIPLYIYAYDWDEYKNSRELNLDFEKDTPFLFTKDPKEIVNAINSDKYNFKDYKKFIDKNVRVPKNGCCNAIIELIKENL